MNLQFLCSLKFRYEKELMHPISNLLNGELARALLIQVLQARLRWSSVCNLIHIYLCRGFSLFQVQKLKLDIETWVQELIPWIDHQILIYLLGCLIVLLGRAMLELDQILKANEINFAVLAALPAFFLCLFLLMLVRAWFKQVRNN